MANLDFLNALQTIGWVSTQEPMDPVIRSQLEKQRDDALDAILQADPNNKDEFRKAIDAHKNFWGMCGALRGLEQKDINFINSDEFLNPTDVSNPIPFQEFHKFAAEQRVRTNLYKADNNVLIGILANNPDVCRAYLAEKTAIGQAKGWQPNVPVPGPTGAPVAGNKSVGVLPDQAVTRIQEQASQTLLNRLIASSTDKVALKRLLDATNQLELNAAMQALGFPPNTLPPAVPARIAHPLSTSIPWLNDFAITREKEVRQAWVKDNFASYVNSLSEEDLLAKKETLESPWKYLADGLDEPYKTESFDLSNEDIQEIRGILGARYLQVVFSQRETALDALNAEDSELYDEIKNFLGYEEDMDYPYIQEAVASNPSLIRQGMLQGLIRNLAANPANLKTLSEMSSAKNLDEFNAGLGKLGITNVDWIEEDEWQEMQEWSHSKALEMVQEQILDLPNNPVNQAILQKINTAKNIEEFRAELKKK